MPFLQQNSSNDPLLMGVGGYAGEDVTVGGQKKTAAGTPSGWYNIQDFLAANPQTPAVKSRIEERGNQQLGDVKSQYESQIKNLPQMPTPETYSQGKFSNILQGGVDQNEARSLSNFLGQSPKGNAAYETPAAQQLPEIKNPFTDIKPGDFNSMMSWFGNFEKPSAEYTPGMQKMDEMLLRKESNFANEYPQQLQNQFKSQIQEPQQQKRTEIENKQKQTTQQFSDEGKNWSSGISGFLNNEKQKINDMYQKQQQLYSSPVNQDNTTAFGADTMKNVGDVNKYAKFYETNQIDPNLYKFFHQGTTPSMGTAAKGSLGQQGADDYNTLAGLLYQNDPNTQYEQYSPQDFIQPWWETDKTGLQNNILSEQRLLNDHIKAEEEKRLSDISKLVSTWAAFPNDPALYNFLNGNYKDNFLNNAVLPDLKAGKNYDFYKIPRAVSTPWGNINLENKTEGIADVIGGQVLGGLRPGGYYNLLGIEPESDLYNELSPYRYTISFDRNANKFNLASPSNLSIPNYLY